METRENNVSRVRNPGCGGKVRKEPIVRLIYV